MEVRQGGERRPERVGVGVAHARHRVPVPAGPAGEGQRPSGRDHVQAPVRVQDAGQAEQVVLVRAAAVVEDQQALRLAGGGTFLEVECGQLTPSESWLRIHSRSLVSATRAYTPGLFGRAQPSPKLVAPTTSPPANIGPPESPWQVSTPPSG